jgi:Cytochrome bd terminal oxidase subunit I
LAHDGPALVDAVVARTRLSLPRPVIDSGDELMDLAKSNLWRREILVMDMVALPSRLQFAFTVSFHIIYPSFTIGLAAWLSVLEALHPWTERPTYRSRRLYLVFARELEKERSMKVKSSLWRITPVHFLERARLYPLDASIADARRDGEMFDNLVRMFEKLLQHFWSSMSLPTSVALATVVP